MIMKNSFFSELREKVCVITGGGGVIGSSITRGIARAGMKPVILDIDEKLARKIAMEIQDETGADVLGLKADVLDRDSLESARDIIHAELGRICFLVNGAGGNSPRATTGVEAMDTAGDVEWD